MQTSNNIEVIKNNNELPLFLQPDKGKDSILWRIKKLFTWNKNSEAEYVKERALQITQHAEWKIKDLWNIEEILTQTLATAFAILAKDMNEWTHPRNFKVWEDYDKRFYDENLRKEVFIPWFSWDKENINTKIAHEIVNLEWTNMPSQAQSFFWRTQLDGNRSENYKLFYRVINLSLALILQNNKNLLRQTDQTTWIITSLFLDKNGNIHTQEALSQLHLWAEIERKNNLTKK